MDRPSPKNMRRRTAELSGRKHLFTLLLLPVLLTIFPHGSLFGADQTDPNLETVTLQLRWQPQFQFAGYYAAVSKGYYREAGLNVRIVSGGAGIDTVDEVVSGRAQYGVSNAEVLLHRLRGKPLVALAAIFQHSPLVIVARRDTGISNPQDLVGKTVKISSASRDLELHATLRAEGISLDQLHLADGIADYNDYFDPRIDALSAYITNQPFYYQLNNIDFTVIRPATYGIDFYGDCLFTSERELKAYPDRVRAFREASLRGWTYAMEHPEEIIQLLQQEYQTEKSYLHLRYEAEAMRRLILPDLVEIGHMNPGRWQHIATTFVRFGMAEKGYSLEGFIYDPNRPGIWPLRIIGLLLAGTLAVSLMAATLYVFNRRLKQEILEREETEKALIASEQQTLQYSKQLEQVSLAATSLISVRENSDVFALICEAIAKHSDYQRLAVSVFKEEWPFRDIIGYSGLSEEMVASRLRRVAMPKAFMEEIFSQGEPVGQMSVYIPHSQKEILNQDAVIYGEGPMPEGEDRWHPHDNLLVKILDETKNFIGFIAVDEARSGHRPTAESVRPLEIFSSLIAQMLIVRRELQERAHLEDRLRQAHKMEAIANLTGGIAHDFNNILGIIIGNADLAVFEVNGATKALQRIENIKAASLRARDIVQQLLTFSRRRPQDMEVVDAVPILIEALDSIRASGPSTIAVVSRIEPDQAWILADPTQIYQILINLCTNAQHAMEDQGGTLAVSADITMEPPATTQLPLRHHANGYLRIAVQDSGKGIPAGSLHQIFDPYFTTKDTGKGTGLGLAIVHGILQSHGGDIQVESTPGKGTMFTLILPLTEPLVAMGGQAEPIPVQPAGGNILLVEDDAFLAETVRCLLDHLGYAVISETDPVAALERFTSAPGAFDLIITDMSMPGLNGKELAMEMLRIRPDLPILLATGHSDLIDADSAGEIGIRGYIRKPLTLDVLGTKVAQLLTGHEAPSGNETPNPPEYIP